MTGARRLLHMDKYLKLEDVQALEKYLIKTLGAKVEKTNLQNRELTVWVARRDIPEVLKFLRDDSQCSFRQLLDICGVDWPKRTARFDVVYHLLSMRHNLRLRVKTQVAEKNTVPSVVGLFSSANWYERETYDMFGIRFEGHPDLRRILTDYDFDGWPLRKDFPVEGKTEVYYDETEKRVAYKPVHLPQEYRHFDLQSPWTAMEDPFALAEEDNTFDRGEFDEAVPDKQEKSA